MPPDRAAANRLQLVNLKNAAQKAGSDSTSTGWIILERFALESECVAEWNDLWNAITDGKVRAATLLLPRGQHPASVAVTAEFVKDHIAICDASAASRTTSVITLSGLRGHITNNVLTFRSTLSPSSKLFHDLLAPSTRASAFTALAPLPRPLSSSYSSPTPLEITHRQDSRDATPSYPSFVVHTLVHTGSLPLLPRPAPHVKGPPLPPRPSARQTTPTSLPAQLWNSFASLFGRAAPSSTSAAASSTVAAAEHLHATLPASVPAYLIGGPGIRHSQVLSEISSALRGELDEALENEDVPRWVRERVHERTQWLAPVVCSKPVFVLPLPGEDVRGWWRRHGVSEMGASGHSVGPLDAGGLSDPGPLWAVAGELTESVVDGGGIEEVAKRLQEFWHDLEEEVKVEMPRWTESSVKDSGRREALYTKHIMDVVERVVCSLFYDRLFLPLSTDDASHDEALSSRITAVNRLGFDYGHVAVEAGTARREIDALVDACGQTLMRLDSVYQSPVDKAATLVSVHKMLADGLSKSLRTNDEILNDKMPTPVSADILIPLMIFVVVKANPPHLVSQLLFTRRFRCKCAATGEEGYCLENLKNIAEYLENDGLAALGLGESEKMVISPADRGSPILPISQPGSDSGSPRMAQSSSRVRGLVEQQVDARVAGSGNNVLTGVVTTLSGVLRAFLPGQRVEAHPEMPITPIDTDQSAEEQSSSEEYEDENEDEVEIEMVKFGTEIEVEEDREDEDEEEHDTESTRSNLRRRKMRRRREDDTRNSRSFESMTRSLCQREMRQREMRRKKRLREREELAVRYGRAV